MTPVRAYGSAVAGVIERDALIYVSYRMRFFTECFSAVFTVTLFYYLSRLVTVDTFGSSDRYFEFVVIGLVILQTVTGTLAMLPMAVRSELVAGTFEQLALSPFGAVSGVLSMAVFPFLRAMVMGIFMIGFAMIACGLELAGPEALLAFPVAILGALAFTPFSLLFAAAIFVFKQAPGAGIVIALVSLCAGLYFPVDLLPAWIQWTSEVQPFTPAVDLLRHLIVGTALDESAWLLVARLAGFALVVLPICVVVMTAALRLGQRRGTVTEF